MSKAPTLVKGAPQKVDARARWFRISACLVLPVLLLLLVEGVLRVVGVGYSTSFFLKRQIDGQAFYIENRDFGRRFFPPGLVRFPHPGRMPQAKEPGALRIFVLGESAAMGDPDPKFGLPRMLEVLLQERYPQRKIQVFNAAMVAINSHVIVPIAQECAQRQSDLWVIYMGNNEVIGPFGALSAFGAQLPPLPLIRASLALKSLRIGQAFDGLMRAVSSRRRLPKEWKGMAMWGQKQVRASDRQTAQVHQRFQRNLDQILETGRAAGIPIVLCTVPTNLKDCAPFGSLHRVGLSAAQLAEWDKAFQEGITLEGKGSFAEALGCYSRALALDNEVAELCYRAGRCHQALGQPHEAAECFQQARDLDTLQFRADSALNHIIRERALAWAAAGVQLLDAIPLFAGSSSNGIPGQDLFYEHVHLNPDGNFLLARAVAEKAAAALALDRSPPGATGTGSVSTKPWSSQEDCLQAVGFTDWNRQNILSRVLTERIQQPPFTLQASNAQNERELREQIDRLRSATKPAQVHRAAAQVAQAAARRPDDPDIRWNLAQLLDLSGDATQAELEWRRVIRLLPQSPLPYANLALLLAGHHRDLEARQLFEACLKLDPDNVQARNALARGSTK